MKVFIKLRKLESNNRNNSLNNILEDEIPQLLDITNVINISVVLVFNSESDSSDAWNNIKSERTKVLSSLSMLDDVQYLLSCIEKFNGNTFISSFPKLELVIGVTKDTIEKEDITNIATGNSSLVEYVINSKGSRNTQHGMVSVILKNTRHYYAYDRVGYPCNFISKNRTITKFFVDLDTRIKAIYIDGISGKSNLDDISELTADNSLSISTEDNKFRKFYILSDKVRLHKSIFKIGITSCNNARELIGRYVTYLEDPIVLNLVYTPYCEVEYAEKELKRCLKRYRMKSKLGNYLEWICIDYEFLVTICKKVLTNEKNITIANIEIPIIDDSITLSKLDTIPDKYRAIEVDKPTHVDDM